MPWLPDAFAPRPEQSAEAKGAKGSIWKEAAFGWTFIRQRPGLLNLLLLFAAVNLMMSMGGVAILPMVLGFANEKAVGTIMMMVGWGTAHLSSMATFSGNPVFEVAHRLWGPAWVLLLIAIVNSLLSLSIATSTSSTRVIYAMGRTGALPRWFGQVDRRFGTPRNAIIVQTGATYSAVGNGRS